jgi:hypothetical protein
MVVVVPVLVVGWVLWVEKAERGAFGDDDALAVLRFSSA